MSRATDLPFLPQQLWSTEVASMAESFADWILPGFIARHNMTMRPDPVEFGRAATAVVGCQTDYAEKSAQSRPARTDR